MPTRPTRPPSLATRVVDAVRAAGGYAVDRTSIVKALVAVLDAEPGAVSAAVSSVVARGDLVGDGGRPGVVRRKLWLPDHTEPDDTPHPPVAPVVDDRDEPAEVVDHPLGRCCEGGYFGEEHDCRKSPGEAPINVTVVSTGGPRADGRLRVIVEGHADDLDGVELGLTVRYPGTTVLRDVSARG